MKEREKSHPLVSTTQGSEGAQRRLAALEKQFPLHDVEPGQCHQLTEGEIEG